MDDTAGQGYVGINAEQVRITGEPLVSDYLGFMFPQDSELTRAFDIALLSMINDGTLAEINNTWFGAAGESAGEVATPEATPES